MTKQERRSLFVVMRILKEICVTISGTIILPSHVRHTFKRFGEILTRELIDLMNESKEDPNEFLSLGSEIGEASDM